jgi:hypothetical protein
MKTKLPPLVFDPKHPIKPAPSAHRNAHAHAAKQKSVERADHKHDTPRSTEETRAAGESFRDALFGPSASEQEAALAMSGGFGEGGSRGQSQGQGGQQKDEKPGRRGPRVAAKSTSGGVGAVREAAGQQTSEAAGQIGADGWMELEIESRVAGRIRLSVQKENGLLRARLNVGNPLAAEWMREHLASVEQQLGEELGCRVKLEMKG